MDFTSEMIGNRRATVETFQSLRKNEGREWEENYTGSKKIAKLKMLKVISNYQKMKIFFFFFFWKPFLNLGMFDIKKIEVCVCEWVRPDAVKLT